MTNRIGGDFDVDAVEAFRAAYAAQLLTPEDLDLDERTGLPTGEISNTSPWLAHTGLWKANDGQSRDFVPNQPFNPEDYYTTDSLDDDNELEMLSDEGDEEAEDDELETLSDEEIDVLIAEILSGDLDEDSEG
jgi:hypothetical protein